ncbi:MAG: response regulator [Paucimonas sp.]|jgi:signal transduction histidine kinase|nr:response regulator [Paucimonas sp.]
MTEWLQAGGEMAERIRRYDWASTALGPIADWPEVLRTTVSLCLDSSFPQAVMWGEELVTLHNDAFAPILGSKPSALGVPFGEVWQEAWDEIRPIAEQALAGKATYIEHFPLVIQRRGAPEQAWFTFCYSPIRDGSGRVVGMLDTVTETTETVLANRKLGFLDALSRATASVTDPEAVMAITTRLLGEHLQLSNCAYADMDADQNGFTVQGEWAAPHAVHLPRRHRLSDFGAAVAARLHAGQPLQVNDLDGLEPAAAATFQALGITATLCMPLVKDGRLTALMAVHDQTPRPWSDYEQALVCDVTQRCWAHIERARAELKVRELKACLEERVELMVAQYKAEVIEHHETRKMETIGQLSGGIAHDFNNLLTPIMGTLDLIRRRLQDPRSQALVDGALHAAERARVLVGRLLTFARRQHLNPQAVRLDALVSGMQELVARSLGPRIRIETHISPQLPALMVDPHQLELAILNLAVNARDAMQEGGRLDISAKLTDIPSGLVKGLIAGRYVCLMVTDNGCGMDESTLKHCMDPFFSTKGVGQGTGLGLSTVQGLAMQSGGAISIASQEGKGTQVSIWLPITEAPVVEDEACVDLRISSRPLQLLLVDDDEMARNTTAMQLHELGYRIAEAGSAAAAMRLIVDGLVVDALITDQIMPGKAGIELARELRGLLPQLPVLIITGYSALTPAQLQGFGVLAKPFRRAELGAALARVLEAS